MTEMEDFSMRHKSIEEHKQAARNTNELLDHLMKIIEQNDARFSFEFASGGEKAVMEIFDKEKKIGYAVKIEPIEYDENGEAMNLQQPQNRNSIWEKETAMLGKKIRYWAMCFVLGYIENGQKKFAKDSDMYKAYEKVILDIQGKYKYR